jgi:hypothetical protein
MTFEFLGSILAGIAANLIATAVKAAREWRHAKRKLKEAEEVRFQAVLAADSLLELGGYLDGPIGSFLVTEYADNAKVKDRVNTFLARLEQYVGTTREIPKSVEAPAALEPGPEVADFELVGVETRLQEGRPWDALAALRRIIERRLMSFARQRDVRLPEHPGAGRLLQVLRQRELLPESAAASLRYAIEIANRGVHGLEVAADEVFEALRHAKRALAAIEPRRE